MTLSRKNANLAQAINVNSNAIEDTIIDLISKDVNMSLRLSNCHKPPIARTEATANKESPILLHFLGVGFQ